MRMFQRVRLATVLAGVLVAMSTALLSGIPMAANAATPPSSSTEIFHTCTGIGNDGVNRAVVCADLWSAPQSGFFGALYFATNDVYCQNLSSRSFVQCAGITETPAIGGSVTPPGGAAIHGTFGGGQQICGTVLGHSPCAVRETVHTALDPNDAFIPPFSAVIGERFTCAFWGESVRTAVRLPSGKTVSIDVLATPHHTFTCV